MFARLGKKKTWTDAQHAAASAKLREFMQTKLAGSTPATDEELFLAANGS